MPRIVKGDGSTEDFDVAKLESSFAHSGAEPGLARSVAHRIAASVKAGMSTSDIYRNAYALLKKEEEGIAARYSMRRAIFDLGPTGFPFEDFISEVMRRRGFTVTTRSEVAGKCARHEVDVLLKKDGRTMGAELKFHNLPGYTTDLKTALYVEARFRDIRLGAEHRGERCVIDEGWLITNTKFTTTAIAFAECSGITLLGWSYPQNASLAALIRETGVYPLTILSSLTRRDKEALLRNGVALCESLVEDERALDSAGIPRKKHAAIRKESAAVCGIG